MPQINGGPVARPENRQNGGEQGHTEEPVKDKGLSDHQQLVITVISVVAVLVANVSFLGYITPPGGPHPTWETCQYSVYVVFLICNGLAFLFSLGAVGVVVAIPWLYPQRQASQHRASINCWIFTGLLLLLLAIALFTVAFVYAGLVTGGFAEPDPICGILPCTRGGKACNPSPEDGSMASLLTLNDVHGECFEVSQIGIGQALLDALGTSMSNLSQYNGSQEPTGNNTDGFDRSACYLAASKVDHAADRLKYTNNTRNVLCTAGIVPGNVVPTDKMAASTLSFYDVLVNTTTPGNFWLVGRGAAPPLYFLRVDTNALCPTSTKGCLCSKHMHDNEARLMYVTYAPDGLPPQVYAASAADAEQIDPVPEYGLKKNETQLYFKQDITVYAPPLFLRSVVAVYDELQFRCSSLYSDSSPILCAYPSAARLNAPKWYKQDPDMQHIYDRQCGSPDNHSQCATDAFAVNDKGEYIMISELADYGTEVAYDHAWVNTLGQQTGKLALDILWVAIALYAAIAVCLIIVRFNLCPDRQRCFIKTWVHNKLVEASRLGQPRVDGNGEDAPLRLLQRSQVEGPSSDQRRSVPGSRIQLSRAPGLHAAAQSQDLSADGRKIEE